jgi:hypothetical protein
VFGDSACSSWPGADLLAARSLERIARRHRAALALLAACALLVRVAPMRDPKPFVVGLIALSGLAVAVETVIAFWAGDRRDARADELIAAGFVVSGRADQVSRAVAERIHALESPRARRRLAGDLRWHVGLERDLVCTRSTRVPAVRGFAPNADLIERVASAVERGPCDPRVLVRLNELLITPYPGTGGSEGVRDTLERICALIDRPAA